MTQLSPASTLPHDSRLLPFIKRQVPIFLFEMSFINGHFSYCNSLNKIISLIVLCILSFTVRKTVVQDLISEFENPSVGLWVNTE